MRCLTAHAEARMAERGISLEDVALVLARGARLGRQGRVVVYLPHRRLRGLSNRERRLERGEFRPEQAKSRFSLAMVGRVLGIDLGATK